MSHLRSASSHFAPPHPEILDPPLLERFHRQMKASLKACTTTTGWLDSLPLVLLGLQTALKQDLGCSTVELVYETTLQVLGEFFAPGTDPITSDPLTYAAQLKLSILSLKAIPTRAESNHPFFVPKDLMTYPFVFVHHDAVRNPLQTPYYEPFNVLHRSDKHFTLDLNGREEVISIDQSTWMVIDPLLLLPFTACSLRGS